MPASPPPSIGVAGPATPVPIAATIVLAESVAFAGAVGIATSLLIAGYLVESVYAESVLGMGAVVVQGWVFPVTSSVGAPDGFGQASIILGPVAVQISDTCVVQEGYSAAVALNVGQVCSGAASVESENLFDVAAAVRGPALRTAPFSAEASNVAHLMPAEFEAISGAPKVAFEAFFTGVPHWILGRHLSKVIDVLGCDPVEARARFAYAIEKKSGRVLKPGGTWASWRDI